MTLATKAESCGEDAQESDSRGVRHPQLVAHECALGLTRRFSLQKIVFPKLQSTSRNELRDITCLYKNVHSNTSQERELPVHGSHEL